MGLAAVVERVAEVAARGRLPVVVFDLDSTLVDTAHRHLRILRAFALTEDDPALSAIVDRLVPADIGYHHDEPLRARGYANAEVLARYERFWWARFFDHAWTTSDLPTPGAVAFVRAVHEAGALVVYLSARSVVHQGLATVESLLQMGFPILGGRTMVHLKPDPELRDTLFKQGVTAELARLGEVVATFENEPAHANHFAEAFPDALHVLLDTCHAAGAPAPRPDVVRVPDFRVGFRAP